MAPKINTNKWSDIQLAIAAISMTSVIAFWNMFAGSDKVQADIKAAEQQAVIIPPTVAAASIEPTVTAVTMPPVGYTIIFGGKAPQPQVIIVQKPKGGGDGNADSGGGNASASQPSTSTSSS